MENLPPTGREVIDRVLEYRELSKLKSTYVDSLPELINPRTHRLHTSYNQVGSEDMLSRAVGGIEKGKVVFALPGSRRAVQLGMEKLIVPEIRHILYEVRK